MEDGAHGQHASQDSCISGPATVRRPVLAGSIAPRILMAPPVSNIAWGLFAATEPVAEMNRVSTAHRSVGRVPWAESINRLSAGMTSVSPMKSVLSVRSAGHARLLTFAAMESAMAPKRA